MNMNKLNLKQYINPKNNNKTKLNTLPCQSLGEDNNKQSFLFKSAWEEQIDVSRQCSKQDIKTLNSCQSPTFATQILSQKTNDFKNYGNNHRFIGDKRTSKSKDNNKHKNDQQDDSVRLKCQNQNLIRKYEQLRKKYDNLVQNQKQLQNSVSAIMTNQELLQKMKKQSFWKMYKQAQMMLKQQSPQIDSLSFLKQMESLRVQTKQIKKNYKQIKAKKDELQKQNTRLLLQIEQYRLKQQKSNKLQNKNFVNDSVSKEQIKKYTEQISRMKQTINSLTEGLKDEKDVNIADKILISQLNKKKIQLDQRVKFSQQIISTQQQKSSNSHLQLQKMKQKNHQLQKTITKLQQKSKRQANSLAGESTNLKLQIQTLQQSLKDKTQQALKHKSQVQKLTSSLKEQNKKSQQKSKQIQSLKTLVQNLNTQNTQMQQCTKQNKSLKQSNTKLLDDLKRLSQIQEQNKKIKKILSNMETSYKQKLLSVEKNYNEVMIKYQNQSNLKVQLQLQNKLLKQAINEKQQEKEKIQTQLKQLQLKVNQLEDEVKTNQQSLQSVSRQRGAKQNMCSNLNLNNSRQYRPKGQKQIIQRRLYSKEGEDYPQKTNKFASFKVYQDTSNRVSHKAPSPRTWSKIKQISSVLKQYLNQNRIRSKYFKNQNNSNTPHHAYQDSYNISHQMSDRLLSQIQANILTIFDKLDHYKKDAQITQEVYLQIQDSKKELQQKDTSIMLKEEIIKSTLLFVPQKYKDLFVQFLQIAESIRQIDPYEYDEQSSIQESFNCLKLQIEEASEDWINQIKCLEKTVEQLQKQNFVLHENTSRQIRKSSSKIYQEPHKTSNRSIQRYRLNDLQKNKARKRQTIKEKYNFR